jgi:hypothetical protein
MIPAQMTDFSEKDCDELFDENKMPLFTQIKQFPSTGPFNK